MNNLEHKINTTVLRHKSQAGFALPRVVKGGLITLGSLGILVTGYLWKAAPHEAYAEFTAPKKGGIGTLRVVGPKPYGFFQGAPVLAEVPAASGLPGTGQDDEFVPYK